MYKIYKTKIKILSSYITPWQSDTIIGHLFWCIKYRYGEERLKTIIESAKSHRPFFIVSDAMPHNLFPKFNLEFDFEKLGIETKEDYCKLKEIKKNISVSLEDFNAFLQGESSENYYHKMMNKKNKTSRIYSTETAITHNVINRLTGTTIDGGVYNSNEKFIGQSYLDIFFKIREGYDISELKECLNDLSKMGFGKKNSTGKGAFQIEEELTEYNEFNEPKNPNGFVVLSNYIPKKGDYEEVTSAEVITKYGKLGGDYAIGEMPFKKPFITYTNGSIFKSDNNNLKGCILEDIHYRKEIIQFGIPFTLGVMIDE